MSKYGVVQDQGQWPVGGIRVSVMSGHFDAITLPTPSAARVAAVPQTDRQTDAPGFTSYCSDTPAAQLRSLDPIYRKHFSKLTSFQTQNRNIGAMLLIDIPGVRLMINPGQSKVMFLLTVADTKIVVERCLKTIKEF